MRTRRRLDWGYVMADLGGWISVHAGHLHLRDQRHPDDVLHVRADEFAAFALMIKGGVYDHLFA